MEAGIKRGLLSPSYMREAWRAEMRMLAAEKLSHAEMLVGWSLLETPSVPLLLVSARAELTK